MDTQPSAGSIGVSRFVNIITIEYQASSDSSTHAFTTPSHPTVLHSITTHTHSPSRYQQTLLFSLVLAKRPLLAPYNTRLYSHLQRTSQPISIYSAHALISLSLSRSLSLNNTPHTGQTVRIRSTHIDGNHHLAIIIILSSHRYTSLHGTHTHAYYKP